MHVDESRRERHIRAIDRFVSVASGAIADNCDASIICCDVGHKRCRTVPVINLGMRENRV